MEDKKINKKDMENAVAGKVVLAFLSVTPQLLVVSLVAYATALMGFNFFFNPNVVMDIIGAGILGFASLISITTLGLKKKLNPISAVA